jgi:hypothetical protein
MTKFEDQLFEDLMREHAPTLAHTTLPSASGRHVATRRNLLAAGAGCAVAGAVAGTLVAGGSHAAGGGTTARAAYAVTKNADGSVTLAVYKTSGFAGANARLRQLDDNQVVVVPVGPGCPSMSSLPAPAVPPSAHMSTQVAHNIRNGSVTVNAQGIPAGDILVVAVETSTNGPLTTSLGQARLTTPPAPSCVSLPAPPPAGTGSGGSVSGAHAPVNG